MSNISFQQIYERQVYGEFECKNKVRYVSVGTHYAFLLEARCVLVISNVPEFRLPSQESHQRLCNLIALILRLMPRDQMFPPSLCNVLMRQSQKYQILTFHGIHKV